MTPELDDTIVAVASPPGPAARGIVRVSGNEATTVVEHVFEPTDRNAWAATRRPTRHVGRVPLEDSSLPAAAYTWPTVRSFTGQPVVELHTIGSPPLLDRLVARICERGGRPAHRGEFTLRAFLAGRLDLVQAEAVLGVIDAHDHVELERALDQLAGGVTSRMHLLRGDLLDLLADVEAGLDFVDEDIEFVSNATVVRRLSAAEEHVAALLRRTPGRTTTRGRRRVVVAGLPNAGKSTLFNRLAGDERALVSQRAGTTRDYLVADTEFDGVPAEVLDTPGWEWGADAVTAEAQRLRGEQIERADLVVWCTASDLDGGDRAVDDRLRTEVARTVLRVATKCDLRDAPFDAECTVSIDTPLNDLNAAIGEALSRSDAERGELLASTSARCHDSLAGAFASLQSARTAAESRAGDEIVALETRLALDRLGEILGAVYTDDVLDRVFSKFCIGK